MGNRVENESRGLRVQGRLKDAGLDGAIFLYSVDIYYFTGSRQTSLLWIPAEGSPVHLIRKSFLRGKEESTVDDVRPFPQSSELPALFEGIRKIGMTFDVLPVSQLRFYEKLLPGREFIDISAINRELRSVKSELELQKMKESGRRLCEVFSQVPSFLRPGMREIDLSAEFEYRLRMAGHEGYLRMRAFNQETTGLAVGGRNAAVPGCFDGPLIGRGLSASAPYGPSFDPIGEDVPVVIDYGIVFEGYMVDMTRVFVIGKLDPELKDAFDTAREIQDWLTENMRPGVIWEDLYRGALQLAAKAGLGDRFMGNTGEQAKFVGHGVGLELDEFPVLAPKFRLPLQAGHVIAIEPKFVFPGRGAVGIENTFAVTENGCEKLTDFPDDLVYL